MTRGSRIKRNSVFAFLSRVIRLVTNVLLFVGIARLYGVEAFGQFTAAHTLSTIFLLLADFGFDSLLPTEIAARRERAAEYARRYFSMKVLFAVGASLVMLVLSVFQETSSETRTLVQIFSLYVFFASLNNYFFALFKSFEQFHHETLISFVTNAILLLLLIVLGILHSPLYVLAICFVGTRIIGIVMGLKTAARLTQGRIIQMSFEGWKDVWKDVMVFGLQFVLGALFLQLDTVLISFLKGDRDVGIYQAAFKIIALVLIVPDVVITTVMPVLARLFVENRARWESLGRLFTKTLLLLGLPLCVIPFVYAKEMIVLVYGAEGFDESIHILRLLLMTVFIRFSVAEAYAMMLTTSRRQGRRLAIVGGGTLLSFLLNLLFIPHYGPSGAATVALITNVIAGVGFVLASGDSFVAWTCNVRNVASSGIVVSVGAVAWGMPSIPMWCGAPVILVMSAATLYFIGFTREEWSLVFVREKDFVQ